jgi:hypothetical protein
MKEIITATSIADNQPTYKGAVNNKYLYLLMALILIVGVISGFWIKQWQDDKDIIHRYRDILLSKDYYYEIPSGGYVYIDDENIRYNENSFDGQLDYQITLNYQNIK